MGEPVEVRVGDAVHSAAHSGVRFSFHFSPAALTFLLAFLTSVVTLIAWLTAKPSRAEVDQQIDEKQKPIIERLDAIKENVGLLRDEVHRYFELKPERDGTFTAVPLH